ncbi:hypothetical protein PYCCODRAFT_1374140 [Trametes coccinea BRFM310]|uniref:AB hydrolase-1 domain-containing protein n=1 Tax=Trametes coccinea (strain BRFM310) TaxID=1353009 RepID=A0A1Y2ICU6_TRAC3|nr:hypothetical protein PYCCODRAFT_1374140 [Trametes coccinea BRFM310]
MQASEAVSSSVNDSEAQSHAATGPTDLVLLVFIHGFKGTDSTFGEFPQRLQHVVSESLGNATVESIVFPAYETKGDLNAAVTRFADWLTDLTVRREVANGLGGGAGKANIVLCGHSMGGLLAADALIEFVNTRPDKLAPLWPNIVACIAFDTPYLGLHPFVFKNSATQAAGYVRSATSVLSGFKGWGSKTATTTTTATKAPIAAGAASSAQTTTASSTSVWQKWAPAAYAVGGALLAGVAAGTAYYKRDDIGVGYAWISDHMKYVGNLWNQEELEARLSKLLEIESQMGVLFHTFYTYLPPSPPAYQTPRTFAVIPRQNTPLGRHFVANRNTLASDEIQAHTGMFDSKSNDGYYELGLSTAQLVRVAVQRHKASTMPPQPPPKVSPVQDAPANVPTIPAVDEATNGVPATTAEEAESETQSLTGHAVPESAGEEGNPSPTIAATQDIKIEAS